MTLVQALCIVLSADVSNPEGHQNVQILCRFGLIKDVVGLPSR
jgi:hypothetical protein